MSIRFRLTLLYSAILVVTLIAFGVSLYLAVSGITIGLVHDAVDAEIRSYGLSIQLHPNPNQGGALQLFVPPDVQSSQDYVQVRLSGGTIAYQSANLQQTGAPLPQSASPWQHQQPGNPTGTIVSIGGQRLWLDTMPLWSSLGPPPGGSSPGTPSSGDLSSGAPPSGAPVGILQVARSLQGVDQTLNTLRQLLLIGGVIVTLVAFGVGWLLAGTALRPINRITQTAQEIGATQDFDRRLSYAGPPDEVGRLASTFNTMLSGLQAAYHTQRRFVADASHELRTPLTSIRGNLGLLQREPPIAEADRVAVVADLVSESERLSRLVSDLLTLARRDAGRPLRQEPVPLSPLLKDLIRRLAVLHPERMIQEDDHADAVAIGDPDALTQVLLILLDNALKFTPATGSVTVSTFVQGDRVSIAVRDTGAGIAPDVLPHIFERFYQGDVARAGTGTGLGLAIAKTLVDGLHGTIDVTSQPGQGSTFTVTLPRATTP